MEKLRVFEAFKGYGSQSLSLNDVGVPHEVVASSEIDIEAIIAYGAMRWDKDVLESKPLGICDEDIAKWLIDRNIGFDFKDNKSKIPSLLKKNDKTKLYVLYNSCILSNELGDISLIAAEEIPDHDFFTMSSPCQDFSVAGKQEGGSWKCNDCDKEFNPIESDFQATCPCCKSENIKKTRSSLLFECAKSIRTKKPKYILLENVKNLVGTKHIDLFTKWCEWLESQGYTNTWKVVNGKDYDIPQNRERVFMFSVLGGDRFEFPNAPCTTVRLKDILDTDVDEKYYINKPFTFIDKKDGNSACNQVGNLDIKGADSIKRVYADDKCSPTLSTMQGGLREPKILEENKLLHIANTDDNFESNARVYSEEGLSPTLASRDYKDAKKIMVVDDMYKNRDIRTYEDTCPTLRSERFGLKVDDTYRIRKLTPKECFRLMGISDERFEKVKGIGISDSGCYKLAGNSIIKNCLDNFFRELFKEYITTENFTRPQEN